MPEQARDDGADAARADDARRLAREVKADEAGEREVAVAHAVVRAVDIAVEREDERERVLRNGVGGVRGHAHDREAEARRRLDVDVVVPAPPARCSRACPCFGASLCSFCRGQRRELGCTEPCSWSTCEALARQYGTTNSCRLCANRCMRTWG